MMAWMGLALMVSTRLWLGGVVSRTRDSSLADRLLRQVRACSQADCARLFCTDGWAAYPQQHQTGISPQSQTNSGAWSSLIAGLFWLAHWNGDQTDGQQTSH